MISTVEEKNRGSTTTTIRRSVSVYCDEANTTYTSRDRIPTLASLHLKRRQTLVTDWRSIHVASIVALITSIQFSMYFSSLWPYLQEVDRTTSENFFGVITAVYSLGQAIASPLFGIWSVHIGRTKEPILAGFVFMFFGNLIYTTIDLAPTNQRYVMLAARFVTGLGGGTISVIRSYVVMASCVKDRSKAISESTGAFALGMTFGPAFQVILTFLGYPGWGIGHYRLNMYTAPAFLACFGNILAIVLLITKFSEHYADVVKTDHGSISHCGKERFLEIPKFDRIAAFICILTRFTQMFCFTNLETIGPPYSMIIFNWTAEQAVLYNSILQGCFGVYTFAIYASYIFFDIGKWLNQRLGCIVGIAFLLAFHLITFPWWGLPGKITYWQEPVNSTESGDLKQQSEPIGCRPSFKWCAYTPPVNVYVYMISYVLLIGFSFPAVNITMNTIYSTIIGPRQQGTMQGLLVVSGSCARLIGPIVVASLFSAYGPRSAWAVELLVSGLMITGWVAFYKRMVPLRKLDGLRIGDVVHTRFGVAERF